MVPIWGKHWYGVRRAHLIRLLRELVPFRGPILLIVLLGLVVSAIQPASVKLSQTIIDSLHKGVEPQFFRHLPLLLVVLFLASGLAKYFHNCTRRYVAERVIIKLRNDLFEKYLYLPLSVLDRRRTGEMLSTIQNDLSHISSGLDTLFNVLKEPFIFFGLFGIAFYFDWRLTLWTLAVAPPVVYLFSRTGALVKRYAANNLIYFSDLMSVSQEAISGTRIVKVFRLERTLLRRFATIHEKFFKTVWKSIRVQEMPTPLVEFIGAILMASVIVYGSYRISQGWLTTGELVAFIIAIGLIQMPIKQLNNAHLKIKAAEAAAERIYSTLDIPTPFLQHSGIRRIDKFTTSLTFQNVFLSYGDKPALKNISFEVKRGECVAFVGVSGSGKSSIVNLLPRLYDVTGGSIQLDGIEIRDLFLGDLRNLISFVTQDTFLFNDSIRENIRFGCATASDKAVENAALSAHCIDFVRKCSDGLDTRIGERGVCLSGGERQRVAIARAILKGAPILVLDEATSNLDSESERVVQMALEVLMKERTTLLVSHRFSTIRHASKIFVMEDGRIKEMGTHSALMGRRGTYAALNNGQVVC